MRYITLPIIAAAIWIGGCKKDPVVAPADTDPTPSQMYASTVMIYPAPADGPDSVHLRGGFVQLELFEDRKAACTVRFVTTDMQASVATYEGTWKRTDDTLALALNGESLLSAQTWIVKGDSIRNVQTLLYAPLEIRMLQMVPIEVL